MLKISRLADYAAVVMHFLATHELEQASANLIAERTSLAQPTVSKVLKLLNEAGLVDSVRGVNGGYHLSRTPKEISVAEIIAAIDGAPALTQCCEGVCEIDHRCGLRGNWQFINRLVIDVLKSISLKDMLQPLTSSTPITFQNVSGALRQKLQRESIDVK